MATKPSKTTSSTSNLGKPRNRPCKDGPGYARWRVGLRSRGSQPEQDYAFKTGGIINPGLIAGQGDTIQRFSVTIKLNHALPSSPLRRLTSYASHHPLYRALRELGRVVRTTFLFQYMHEEETRLRVNHQLTKADASAPLSVTEEG